MDVIRSDNTSYSLYHRHGEIRNQPMQDMKISSGGHEDGDGHRAGS
jgi:hypothetical protein